MDGQRFDELTRALAGGTSRRRVLKGLLGGGVGGALGAIGLRGANAATPRPAGATCVSNANCVTGICDRRTRRCVCGDGLTNCNRECVDTLSDPINCGACGNACPTGAPGTCQGEATCTGGVCGLAPAAPGTVCRAATSLCDPAEVCDGASFECPADVVLDDGVACGAAGIRVCCAGACLNCGQCETCDSSTGLCGPNVTLDNVACPNDSDRVCCAGSCTNCGQCETCDGATGLCVPDTARNGLACPNNANRVCCDGTCEGSCNV